MRLTVRKLQRHGARWPTEAANVLIKKAVEKLQRATSYADPAFEFLHTYQHAFESDDLTPYGIQEYVCVFLRNWKLIGNKELVPLRGGSTCVTEISSILRLIEPT